MAFAAKKEKANQDCRVRGQQPKPTIYCRGGQLQFSVLGSYVITTPRCYMYIISAMMDIFLGMYTRLSK